MGGFLRGFCCLFLPVILLVALRIWKPPYEPGVTRSILDRTAWTVFALGICLMFNMALYAMVLESDGGYRSWDQIQFHVKTFFVIAFIPLFGPLVAFLWERSTEFREAGSDSKLRDRDIDWIDEMDA